MRKVAAATSGFARKRGCISVASSTAKRSMYQIDFRVRQTMRPATLPILVLR